jgi:Methane oxygenase PmoA
MIPATLRHRFKPWAFGLAVVSMLAGCANAAPQPRVRIHETNQVVQVELDGRLFTQYHFRDVSRPFLYPILAPDDRHMTRRWPQEEIAGEERDHPHHKGLWWAHGDANGVDFWSESKDAGRTVHQSFAEITSGAEFGVITSRNRWIAKDGKVIASDERTMRFYAPKGDQRWIDFTITIFASHGDLVLGDTKEGSMAIRIAESMRLKQPKGAAGQGHIENSDGVKDGYTWGKRASWVDYTGPVEGKTVGVAIFDHPSNPRFPTWWHVRDYGLFAANPFGVHDFEKKDKGAGNLTLPSGRSTTFRYRFVFHPGDTDQSRMNEAFRIWTASTTP